MKPARVVVALEVDTEAGPLEAVEVDFSVGAGEEVGVVIREVRAGDLQNGVPPFAFSRALLVTHFSFARTD